MKGTEARTGDQLPEIRKTVTQEQVNAYAEAAKDFNPIHLDESFAKGTPFGARIAHGMLTLAFISQMMATAFPETWDAGGALKVRFKAAVFPGETVVAAGEVTEVKDGPDGPTAYCKVACLKPDGTEAIAGQATVPLRVG